MPSNRPLSILAPAALALLAACSTPESAPSPPPQPMSEDDGGPAGALETVEPRSYDVRGEVFALPEAEGDSPTMKIRHEAIDDLVGVDGEVWGMDSMTMPFALDPDVDLTDVQVGDKVRFTLLVDWTGAMAQRITALEELPAETELEFREARVPGAEPEGDAHDAHDVQGGHEVEDASGDDDPEADPTASDAGA